MARFERLEFHLVSRCTSRCVFCSEAARMLAFAKEEFSFKEAVEILRFFNRQGTKHLNITGGEPTLFSHLPELLAEAKRLGFTTYLATNGVRTQKPAYFARIAPVLDELCVSLHGATADVHDSLTGVSGSFNGLMQTIEQVNRTKMRLYFNTVVTKTNVHEIPQIIELAGSSGASGILVSALAPEGRGLEHYRSLALRFDRWRSLVDACVKAAHRFNVVLRFFGVPMCLLGDHRVLSNDLYFDPRITVERIRLPDGMLGWVAVYSSRPVRERVYAKPCQSCPYRGVCGGVFERHLQEFPEDESLLTPKGT